MTRPDFAGEVEMVCGLTVQPNSEADENPFTERTHSFIVKIWLEDSSEETGRARWRGLITHVPDGHRKYVEQLSDVTLFLVPYLRSMQVPLGLRWKLWQWMFGRDS